jgi:IS5 family transposase
MALCHHSGKPEALRRQDFPLLEHLNARHPLFLLLAKAIDREAIERVAYATMESRHRRSPLRPRLVAGLLHVQHTFNLSNKEIVRDWVENPHC